MPIPIPTLASIFELLKDTVTIEAKEKIMQLRIAATEREEEILHLREQLCEADRKLELRALTFDGRVYWEETAGQRNGPFCPRCCDADQKRIRLHDKGICWYCHTCRHKFLTGKS